MTVQIDVTAVVIAVGAAAIGFVGTVIVAWNALTNRVTSLETSFWKDVVVDTSTILHKSDPTKKHMDNLLETYDARELTEPQVMELFTEMSRRVRDETLDDGQRIGASLVKNGVKRAYPEVVRKVNGINVVKH